MKKSINKLDIARWIAVLPITVIALILFATIFIEIFYKALNTFLNKDTVAHIVGYINAFSLPAIITACTYWVSPKFKFKSTLLFANIFIVFQVWYYFNNEYIRHGVNPYVTFYAMSYLTSFYVVYKLDNKK